MYKDKLTYSVLWYKEPWPWIIIFIIFTSVLFSLSILWISLHINNDLVSDNYYEEGKNIFKEINKEKKAQQLKINAKLFIKKDMRQVYLIMQGNHGKILKLRLEFIHPFLKVMDKHLILTQSKDDARVYTGEFNDDLPIMNHWYIHLCDMDKSWIVRGKWFVNQGNVISLDPVLEKYAIKL